MLVGDDAITGAGVSPILIIRLPMAIIIRRLPMATTCLPIQRILTMRRIGTTDRATLPITDMRGR
jgi:hypothetical protein